MKFAEIDISGVFVSSVVALGVTAFLLTVLLRRLASAVGFYRIVWHPALFDVALFVILFAGCLDAALYLTRT